MAEISAVSGQLQQPHSFARNVAWSWLGVGVSLFSGIFLSPYMIRKLGHEGYGVWALVFSMVDYYLLMDLGFRSATVKYVAHHRAKGEVREVNEAINSSLAYFCAAASLLVLAIVPISKQASRFFVVSPGYRGVFSFLILLVGGVWSLGLVFHLFGACLEAFQRFDLSNRNWILSIVVRVAAVTAVLAAGYGLVQVAIAAVAGQLLLYALGAIAFWRVFPALRLSLALVQPAMLRKLFRYGMDTVPSSIAWLLLLQGPSVVVGHLLPAAFVGYYSLPWRLIQVALDMVYRVGNVTRSKTAELCARAEYGSIIRLGTLVNRYSATLFLPGAIYLWMYGRELLTVWVGASFAAQSGPVLPFLVVGALVGDAGQFNSSSMLFGLARQRAFSCCLLAESLISVAAMLYVIPRFGLAGAAAVCATMMILNRGLVTSWLICRALKIRLPAYLASIYVRPAAAGAPALLLAYILKRTLLPGVNLVQLVVAAALVVIVYAAPVYFICLPAEHRELVRGYAAAAWSRVGLR